MVSISRYELWILLIRTNNAMAKPFFSSSSIDKFSRRLFTFWRLKFREFIELIYNRRSVKFDKTRVKSWGKKIDQQHENESMCYLKNVSKGSRIVDDRVFEYALRYHYVGNDNNVTRFNNPIVRERMPSSVDQFDVIIL